MMMVGVEGGEDEAAYRVFGRAVGTRSVQGVRLVILFRKVMKLS